jgi:2-oxo-4-hydroxy-4-carboxy--5-ureidoimidazoline (OHCU) decarboxylase
VPERLTLEGINRLGRDEFVARLGSVFEGSPWVAQRVWVSRPFGSFAELYGAVAGELTPESTGEQASAGLDSLTQGEYEAFTEMNRTYRERFGFPMIVCVREHTKESILRNAGSRLQNSREQEVETALGEIAKIARLRLKDLVEQEGGR